MRRAEAAVVTSVDARVLEITLNRPEAKNAINGEVSDGLRDAFARLDQDPGLTVGILTGEGSGFCSGMDLKAFSKYGAPKGLDRLLRHGTKKPLVGAIEGFALAGGLELALLCDIIIAAEGAIFGLPEVKVGLVAAGGGLFRLGQRLPQGVAMEMALTGDGLSAERAAACGLVNHMVVNGAATREARNLAHRIAENAPLSVAASKEIVCAADTLNAGSMWDFQRTIVPRYFNHKMLERVPVLL